jgi:hypothetical protein
MRCAIVLLTSFLAGFIPSIAETVTLVPDRDATLIEDPNGSLANGAGPVFFVGRTAQSVNGVRRALLRFDVASALPHDAIIGKVALTLFMTPSNPDPHTIRLYRVLAEWGEGPSASSGGGGAAALPGDVTWLHTFWDTGFWVQPGGQFLGRPSASAVVAGPGSYAWSNDRYLAQDVRIWNAAPDRNFGWILIGDEGTPQTSKSFASRESPDPVVRPVLEITYRSGSSPARR